MPTVYNIIQRADITYWWGFFFLRWRAVYIDFFLLRSTHPSSETYKTASPGNPLPQVPSSRLAQQQMGFPRICPFGPVNRCTVRTDSVSLFPGEKVVRVHWSTELFRGALIEWRVETSPRGKLITRRYVTERSERFLFSCPYKSRPIPADPVRTCSPNGMANFRDRVFCRPRSFTREERRFFTGTWVFRW